MIERHLYSCGHPSGNDDEHADLALRYPKSLKKITDSISEKNSMMKLGANSGT